VNPSTKYKWYVLGVLTLAQTCHSIDRAIIGLVLEPVGKEFHLSDSQRGFLAGFAYGIFFAIAAIPFGVAVDRVNRRNLMTIALTLWSAATALCGLAAGYASLLMGRAAVGMAEAGGTPTGMSLLSDYFPKERRATALGIWYLSSGVGLSIAFFVGGWLIAEHGWRTAFIAAGLPGLLLAPVLFLTVREPVRGGVDNAHTTTLEVPIAFFNRVQAVFAKPGIAHCILAIILIATGIYGMSTWVTSFLIRVHHVPIKQAGLMIAITYGVLGSFGGFAAGWGVDALNARRGGFNPARTAALSALIPMLTALTGMTAMMAPGLPLCLGFLFACGFFSASYNGPIYAVIVDVVGPELRGLTISIAQFGANLIGVGAGAYIIGAISQHIGGTSGVAWGIGIALLFTLWGGLHLWLASRAIRRATLGAHTPLMT
jgi:predicted MFS family arabinose efflux permease